MTVERKTAPYKEVFGGIEYCFCSRECWDAFQNEPARYSAQK
jgi:YHS domain-containing protein